MEITCNSIECVQGMEYLLVQQRDENDEVDSKLRSVDKGHPRRPRTCRTYLKIYYSGKGFVVNNSG